MLKLTATATAAAAVTEGAPGCFAGAFSQIALMEDEDGGTAGSPG